MLQLRRNASYGRRALYIMRSRLVEQETLDPIDAPPVRR
jgi:hypothetical protein